MNVSRTTALRSDTTPATFSVLFVCTANQARSPMAQRLLERALGLLNLHWTVTSAGTDVRDGQEVHPLTAAALAEVGVEVGGFRPRQLTEPLVAAADLVLTAETRHRHRVVATHVGALSNAFTLLQFVRYTSAVELESTLPATLGADLLTGVRLARSRFQPASREHDDIPDPVGGKIRDFRACRDSISAAIDRLVLPLAASPAIAPGGGLPDPTASARHRSAGPTPSRRGIGRARRTIAPPGNR